MIEGARDDETRETERATRWDSELYIVECARIAIRVKKQDETRRVRMSMYNHYVAT